MDFWTSLALSVLLQVVANRNEARRIFPGLAKLYVKIHLLAQASPELRAEIEKQEAKIGGA